MRVEKAETFFLAGFLAAVLVAVACDMMFSSPTDHSKVLAWTLSHSVCIWFRKRSVLPEVTMVCR